MSTASSSANSMQRAAPTHRAQPVSRPSAEPVRTLQMGTDEAAVLNLDLSGLPLPKVGGLNVDGFKPTFFQRLFGKR